MVSRQFGSPTSQANVVVVIEPVNGVNLPTDIIFPSGGEQIADSRVLLITAQDLLGLFLPISLSERVHSQHLTLNLLVRFVDVVNSNDGQVTVITEIAKCDSCASLDPQSFDLSLGNIQSNGYGEECSIHEPKVLNNSVPILTFIYPSIPEYVTTNPL